MRGSQAKTNPEFFSLIKFNVQCNNYDKKHPSFLIVLSLFQGDLVFWYNLMKSGKSDESTKHAACPVVLGSKWGKRFANISHFAKIHCLLNTIIQPSNAKISEFFNST